MADCIRISPYGNKVKTKTDIEYLEFTAPLTTPVDTGLLKEDLIKHTEITCSLVVLVGGTTQYILFNNIYTEIIKLGLFEDIRVSRTTEFETGSGDVSFSFWISSADGHLYFDYDFDPANVDFGSAAVMGLRHYV